MRAISVQHFKCTTVPHPPIFNHVNRSYLGIAAVKQLEKQSPRTVAFFEDLRGLGVPYSRAYVHQLIGEGKFPKRWKLGLRNAWWADEITAWVVAHANAKPDEAAQKRRHEIAVKAGKASAKVRWGKAA